MAEAPRKRAIVDMFKKAGVMAWVNHAGRVKVKRGWMHLSPEGTPDVIVIVPPRGRILCLEVKDEGQKERSAQLVFAAEARKKGAFVATVRTPDEAFRAYCEAAKP